MSGTFVGFGFGAIQGGLFLYEAFRSGNFDRLVVAEVMPQVVDAVRNAGGEYHLNIALPTGIDKQIIKNIDILKPADSADADLLVKAVSEASEIATALPSIDFFNRGGRTVAQFLADGFKMRYEKASVIASVVYTGENNNFAAEVLQKHVEDVLGEEAETVLQNIQFLNTVIGKMSGVVTDSKQVERSELDLIVPELKRAFLVEEFNRILITKITLPGFVRGIDVFTEKSDLHSFEEAKLYGHNATHALIGYLAHEKGYNTISKALADYELKAFAREAFLNESGKPLIKKYAEIDPLFSVAGYREYVDDLLERMANPYLEDLVERIIRDPQRKLSWDDRLIGTMRLAFKSGIEPKCFAQGAAAALHFAAPDIMQKDIENMLRDLWGDVPAEESKTVIEIIKKEFSNA